MQHGTAERHCMSRVGRSGRKAQVSDHDGMDGPYGMRHVSKQVTENRNDSIRTG